MSACTVGSSPDAQVSDGQIAAIHADLKKRQLGAVRAERGLHAGCAERRLGADQTDSELAVYLLYTCDTWTAASCSSESLQSGTSAAAVAYLHGQKVERWRFPGDGDHYAQDIKAWFPRGLRTEAIFPGNQAVDRLLHAASVDAECNK
jgi:hypothetical protein